jgi:hypothetical protein
VGSREVARGPLTGDDAPAQLWPSPCPGGRGRRLPDRTRTVWRRLRAHSFHGPRRARPPRRVVRAGHRDPRPDALRRTWGAPHMTKTQERSLPQPEFTDAEAGFPPRRVTRRLASSSALSRPDHAGTRRTTGKDTLICREPRGATDVDTSRGPRWWPWRLRGPCRPSVPSDPRHLDFPEESVGGVSRASSSTPVAASTTSPARWTAPAGRSPGLRSHTARRVADRPASGTARPWSATRPSRPEAARAPDRSGRPAVRVTTPRREAPAAVRSRRRAGEPFVGDHRLVLVAQAVQTPGHGPSLPRTPRRHRRPRYVPPADSDRARSQHRDRGQPAPGS